MIWRVAPAASDPLSENTLLSLMSDPFRHGSGGGHVARNLRLYCASHNRGRAKVCVDQKAVLVPRISQ